MPAKYVLPLSSLRQCEYEMLFSICPGLHSPFNFPTGLQLLFTQIAVQLISSHAVKIIWVTKLKYIRFIDRRLLDTFANIQGAIISKGKYFSDKKSFPLSFWVVWAVGHNRVWLGRQCWWLLSWGYCHLSEGRSALGQVPVCSVSGFDHLIAGM